MAGSDSNPNDPALVGLDWETPLARSSDREFVVRQLADAAVAVGNMVGVARINGLPEAAAVFEHIAIGFTDLADLLRGPHTPDQLADALARLGDPPA